MPRCGEESVGWHWREYDAIRTQTNLVLGVQNKAKCRYDSFLGAVEGATRGKAMTISFEIPQEIEQQIRTSGLDLDRDAKEVYLMEQYRQAKITHRQLEEALDLGFHDTEQLLKRRGMGQDLDIEEFEEGRELLRKARTR